MHECNDFFSCSFLFSSGEFSRQVNDFKIRQQKAEQDNARLEGLVSGLRDCQSNTTP